MDQDVWKDIFENNIAGYESKDSKQYSDKQETLSKEDIKECSAFSSSVGLRCVSYHNCGEKGEIIKDDVKQLINIRIDTAPADTQEDADLYYQSLYCPGKFEICCKDPEFVQLDSIIEAVLAKEEKHENIAIGEQAFALMNDADIVEDKKECPSQWLNFSTSCYYFAPSPTFLTWAGAASACSELHENSTLPSVLSEAEDQFIQDRAPSYPLWLGGFRNIGAPHREASSWQWTDGSAMNFTAWATWQPNNYWYLGERCVRSVLTGEEREGEGTWDDHRCWLKNSKAVVCKLDLK